MRKDRYIFLVNVLLALGFGLFVAWVAGPVEGPLGGAAIFVLVLVIAGAAELHL